MATRKKTRRPSAARQKPKHTGADSDHGGEVIITIKIGPLERIPKRRKGKKASPTAVKAFLKWVLAEL